MKMKYLKKVILFMVGVVLFFSYPADARRIREVNIIDALLSQSRVIIKTDSGSEFIMTYREEPPDDRFHEQGSRHTIEIATPDGKEIGYICARINGIYAEINEDFRYDPAYYYYDHPDNQGKSRNQWGLGEDLKSRTFEPALMVDKTYSKDRIGQILITLGLKALQRLGVECVAAVNVSRMAERYYKKFGFETIFKKHGIINMRFIMVLDDEYETPVTLPG
ncbi:MAG: GNAT family N-acetyltransferase, partial [Candidatus Kaelpia imicola]|nr:GNAT family N-acetyltransferase [Candidatus Kaelpia imicola]